MTIKPKIAKLPDGKKINVHGDHITIKLSGKDTNGQYTLMEQDNPPGTKTNPHIHKNEDEVFAILEGEVKYSLDGKELILQKGDLAFCPRGIAHSWEVMGTENAKVLLSAFPAGIEEMFIKLSELSEKDATPDNLLSIFDKYGIINL